MKKIVQFITICAVIICIFIIAKLKFNNNDIVNITPVNDKTTVTNLSKSKPQKQFSFIHNNKILIADKNLINFHDVTPSNVTNEETMSSICFINTKIGYTVSYNKNRNIVVYKTIDSGKTWTSKSINLKGIPEIQFIDNNTGWILVHQGAGMMHEEVTLLSTTDMGDTWTIVSHSDTKNANNNSIPFVGDKTGFNFADNNKGYLTGYWPVSNKAYLFATEDSGKSWNEKTLSYPDKYKDCEIATEPPIFFSYKDGILFASISSNSLNYIFYKTNDGGKTWVNNSVMSLKFVENPKWSFFNKKQGYITDGKSLYYTNNSGNTWKIINNDINFSNITNFVFSTTDNGLITSKEGIYYTSDRGKSWNLYKESYSSVK